MDKLLKIGKLIAYGSEAVLAICVATETVKNFIASRKAKNQDNNGRAAEGGQACPQTD